MKLRVFVLAVASIAFLPLHARAQGAAAAVAHLVAPLPLAAPMKQALQAEMVRTLGGDGLSWNGRAATYTVMGCEDTEMSARLVDLNGDAVPEVHVEAQGTCVGGMAGGFNWVFIRSAAGAWRMNLNFNGGLYPLPSHSQGFTDVLAGGPGFCHGVWRWTGQEYALLCVAGEGGQRCDRPCPRTLKTDDFGEQLPPFTAARSGAEE
ncbi:hypothetical protein [Longimicrobium sp.]|uniref:hypothetical protein n=1 Tax=Longimicrobium sp. TaxID=2029185 RepID=UPI002C1CDF85|nr:hypothetical protein [Longimicrobium sp.]HSU14619.1 hypothetical protein [Longimicrobium sp.]